MKRLLSGLSVLLFVPCLAYGLNARDQMLSLNLGFVAPVSVIEVTEVGGGEAQAGSLGFNGGAQYLFVLNPRFAIGGEFNVTNTGSEDDSDFLPRTESELDVKSTVVMAIARLNLARAKTTVPFIFVGLGVHNTQLKIDARPQFGYVWSDTGTQERRSVVDSDESGVVFATGGGADFLINDHFFLGVEGRLQFLGTADYDTTASSRQTMQINSVEGSFVHLNLLARIGYRFGGPRKAPAPPV